MDPSYVLDDFEVPESPPYYDDEDPRPQILIYLEGSQLLVICTYNSEYPLELTDHLNEQA